MNKLEVVDYLKGFSIFTIVVMHLLQGYVYIPSIINKLVSLGGSGVHIFIICSGFGLYYSQLNKKLNFKEFFLRRFTKIYIPYMLIILISSLLPILYTNNDRIVAFLSHAFLFKMFVERYECSFGIQFWFISTIIQFYIVFNILVKIKSKISNRMFLLLGMSASIFWWIMLVYLGKSNTRVWNGFFLQYLWEFVVGMILADLYYKRGKLNLPKKSYLVIGSICGLFITGVTGIKGGYLRNFNDIPSVIGYGGLALLLYSLKIKFINSFFIKLNEISYEWYLVHILVFEILIIGRTNNFINLIIALFLSILVAKTYSIILGKIYFKKKTNIIKNKQVQYTDV